MSKTTISFFDVKKGEKEYLVEKLKSIKDLYLKFLPNSVSTSALKKIKNTNILAVFVYSEINKKVLSALPNLKFITTMSTGFDHIDLKECRARNIKVSNIPFYGENTVAEHTFALILALAKRLPESLERTRKYNFSLDNIRGFDLKGKTLGIVGLGSIGKHIARIANGFEMEIIACDPKRDSKTARNLGIEYTDLDRLLSRSDVITLHAPHNENTHHLINRNNIKLIKKGAYLINTARGGLVETQALITALDRKILAGAGLDVLEGECFIRKEKELLTRDIKNEYDLKTVLHGHLLIQDSRVLVTPHNAFNSEEAMQRILDITVKNIKGYLKNKAINLVQ